MNSTNSQDTLHGYKGQARRLALALKELSLPVSHSQALDLIGRVHGNRDWKELCGLATAQARAAATVLQPAELSADERTDKLDLLEHWLRLQGISEEALDMLVHDHAAPARASEVNNSGLFYQLSHLLEEACDGSFERLQTLLKSDADLPDSFNWRAPAVSASAWASQGAGLAFDALPWLLKCGQPSTLKRLLESSRAGYIGNCDLGDDVAAWTRMFGSSQDRESLDTVFAQVCAAQTLDEDAVGITVSIDPRALKRYVRLMRDHGRMSVDEMAELVELLERF